MRRLAIHHPAGRTGLGANVFGMEVANFELFQALARHGGLDRIDFLTHVDTPAEEIRGALLGRGPSTTEIGSASVMDQALASASGAVLRGQPRIDELAWVRRRTVGDRAYSLLGLIHTIAPPAMRQDIAMAAIGPTRDWDALICTSPSIQAAMTRMFEEWTDYLGDRFGGKVRPGPRLPLLPLGVNGDRFARAADRPDVRRRRRETLGVGPTDVVVLWVGRLSFFEKAFPQPMFRAVQEAMSQSGVKLHFALVGWFPGGEADRERYAQAAGAYAPDVAVHVLDGNDRDLVDEMWAAADIFLSLVDNIQETFGITPIEAMAAGLPVVVSDWDGYRYTVRDGIEGVLVPTLGAPVQNLMQDVASRHALGLMSYQSYVGTVAQHTAVHVGRAAQAIAALAVSSDRRKEMGAAGRRRIAMMFDWRVVAPQYSALADELAAVREGGQEGARGSHPLKGDPARDFSGFPTRVLRLDDVVWLRPGVGVADLDRADRLDLDRFAGVHRATPQEARALIGLLSDGTPKAVRPLLEAYPVQRRRALTLTIMWMAKIGILDWRAPPSCFTPRA